MAKIESVSRWERGVGAAVILAAVAAALSPAAVHAIPAFARRYGTSCQTCHIAYPKLNPFGESFRLLGYHLPGETEAQIKQPDVPLGAEAYKKVWPNAVWPGMIPSHIPLALTAEFLATDSSMVEGGEVEKVQWDFAFPSEAALVAGGSAGDNVSYFGEIAFEQGVEDGVVEQEVGVEHFDIRFVHLLHGSPALNVKVGAFQPELVNAFDHARRLTVANYDSMFGVATVNPGGAEAVGGGGHHGGGGGLALPAVARGVELFGVAAHRLFWTAGLVNGLGPGAHAFDGNTSKDTYARAAYKWGGLAPDGSNAATYAGSPKNWREKSLSVGVFGYHGNGSGILFPAGAEEEHEGHGAATFGALGTKQEEMMPAFVEDRSFDRWGFDFNLFYQDVNVFGAYVDGSDDLSAFAAAEDDPDMPGPLIADDSGKFSYKAWFVEADAVLGYPWLHGAVRYENVSLPKVEDDRPVGDFERATVSWTALIRANVKATAEYTWDLNESRNRSTWVRLAIAF